MTKYYSISYLANSDQLKYSNLILSEFFSNLNEQYCSDPWILSMEGMSGKKYRDYINRLISKLQNPRYLEIGVWQGSTLCAAINNNTAKSTAIDNWSQFNGPRNEFFENLKKIQGNSEIMVIEQDFRKVDYEMLAPHNIYFFDGPHEYIDHYDALKVTQPALENEFILIVDDWNSHTVQQGTIKALDELNYRYHGICLTTTHNGAYPEPNMQNSDWHNGYFIASVVKSH